MSAAAQELRVLKVRYRAKSLLRVSQSIAAGAIDETALREATVEEQRAALPPLHGVGPASVGYILIDVFHALDQLRHVAPWEHRIYSHLLLGTPVDEPAPADVLLERSRAGRRGVRSPSTICGRSRPLHL